jgi:hypothetical protein
MALHDVQQRFADDVPAPPACLVRRQGGGLLWRKRREVRCQTLFELAGELGRDLNRIPIRPRPDPVPGHWPRGTSP